MFCESSEIARCPTGGVPSASARWVWETSNLEDRPIRSKDLYAVSLAVHLGFGPNVGFHSGTRCDESHPRGLAYVAE